jgi:hypothetical protein
MAEREVSIPRTIWFLWFQGLSNAPYVVRKCHESWVARNPGWRVVNLDASVLPNFSSVDYSAGNIAKTRWSHRADLLRLDLLAHHGGVWADASCFCVRPLDEWLPSNTKTGFFAFHRPGMDRIMSTWFLGAEPGNVLVSRLFDRMLEYWGDHSFRNDERRFLVHVLTGLLKASPRTRSWWFSRPLRDWLALTPYYAFHYGFEKLVREDPECARIWHETPDISADGPHRLLKSGVLAPASAALRGEIDRREVPVYKLTWKLGDGPIPMDSALGYLLQATEAPLR